jgi:c-di-GMP-binding flagellar brake protein YcgR
MSGMDQLAVRQAQRHDVALRGRFTIAETHASAIRLARNSGLRDGVIEADVVDFSAGGLGLLSHVFVPKRAVLNCKLFLPQSEALAFECEGTVTRVVMTDRRPMYLIGVTFREMSAAARDQLAVLLAALGEIA